MAIITLAEAKVLLQISASTYDTLIAAQIPVIQEFIVRYCNNPFHVTSKKISASTISFADDDPDTINDSASGFVTAGFTDGIDIDVQGSVDNDGIYAVDTVSAGVLTLSSVESLIAEDAGAGVIITRVRFPVGLKMIVSKMLGFDLQQANMYGISEKSLGDFRVKYGTGGGGVKDASYPAGLLADLNTYRRNNIAKIPSMTYKQSDLSCNCNDLGSCNCSYEVDITHVS